MITYKGEAVPVLSIAADWRGKVSVTETYANIIREAIDTSEERIARRSRPLYKISFDTTELTADETAYLRSILQSAGERPFAVPFWQDKVRLTEDALSGNAWVDTEATAGTLFDVLPYAMVWSDYRTFTTHRTFSVGANQIVLADPLTQSFIAGEWIVPMAVGKLAIPDMSALTDIHGAFKVTFEEAFLVDSPMVCSAIEGVDVEATYFMETECVGGALL